MSHIATLIPTTGATCQMTAIESVRNSNPVPGFGIRPIIVSDGPEAAKKTALNLFGWKVARYATPDATGADGHYGHRIYANYSQLLNADFITFLDEDNWYAPEHLASLVHIAAIHGFAWSLRTVVRQDGNLIGVDRREAIGRVNEFGFPLVDTSCWMFRRDMIHHARAIEGKWGADRQLTAHMIHEFGEEKLLAACSGLPTLFYRAPERLYPFFEGICTSE